MDIKQRINSDLKIALLAGEKHRATTLRGLKSVILNAEIAASMRDKGLPDEQLIQLLNKEIKKRVESAEMYVRGGSPERAGKELQEKNMIAAYLPAQLADEALTAMVAAAIEKVQPTGIQDMGKVMNVVREQAAGQADNTRIAAAVKQQLNKGAP